MAGDHARHRRELPVHLRIELGTRGHEVLEVARVPDQDLAAAFEDVAVQPRDGMVHVSLFVRRPFLKRFQLDSRLLREQEIRDADRKFGARRQRRDGLVVVRIRDPGRAGIDGAGHAKAVELPKEVLGRVEPIPGRERRELANRGVYGQGTANDGAPIHEFVAAAVGRLALRRELQCRDPGLVEQNLAVGEEDQDRRVRSRVVQLRDGRESLLVELELRHLRYFLAVAEEGHFGRAAQRLHIVQPALSMQVRALEAELGTALFERTSRRVVLTEAGVLFRVEAERTIQQAARAKDVAQRAARGEVGKVRIGFVGNAAFAGKLAADVSSFNLAYPQVDLELTELSPLRQVDAVLAGHLDAGYTSDFRYTQERELAVDRIATWPWMLAMRSNHPLVERAAVSAEALRGEAFVVYAAHADDDGQVRILRQLLGEEPRVLHHVPNSLTVVTLAAAGMGLALVPGSLEAVNIPNLAYRPLADFPLRYDLVLVSRRNEPSPAVRRFVEIARASGSVAHQRSVAPRKPRRPNRRRQ
jgi:DNA-binding transcriptional LysR family regulator